MFFLVFFLPLAPQMFVELDELTFCDDGQLKWVEKCRWIKFEEDVEEAAERWGKPHVASLSFRSLVDLRKCLKRGESFVTFEPSRGIP